VSKVTLPSSPLPSFPLLTPPSPRCFGGYFINLWCSDLQAHQGQQKEFQVKNVCPDCGFFSANWSDYPKACERLKAQTLRSRVPFLRNVNTSVLAIERALTRALVAVGPKHDVLDAFKEQPIATFLDSAASRMAIRRLMLAARQMMMVSALESVDPLAAACSRSAHARLLLQLMGLSEGYSAQFCHPLNLCMSASRTSDAYTIAAVLLSFAARLCWSADTLDKIVSGDIGERGAAQSFVKRALDQAACHIYLLFPSYMQSSMRRRLQKALPGVAAAPPASSARSLDSSDGGD
jgi:hypothetical protein